MGATGMPGIPIGIPGTPGIIAAGVIPGIAMGCGVGAGVAGVAASAGLLEFWTARASSAFVLARRACSAFFSFSCFWASSGFAANSLDRSASARLSMVLTRLLTSSSLSSCSIGSSVSSRKNRVFRISAIRSSMLSKRSAGVLPINLSTSRSSSGATFSLRSEGGGGLVARCLLSRSVGDEPVNGG